MKSKKMKNSKGQDKRKKKEENEEREEKRGTRLSASATVSRRTWEAPIVLPDYSQIGLGSDVIGGVTITTSSQPERGGKIKGLEQTDQMAWNDISDEDH